MSASQSSAKGPPGFQSRTREPSLLLFVEQYLADNANLSYVNIQDMIDTIQGKNFRFGRMKRQVFAGMVRRAYNEYVNRQSGSSVTTTSTNNEETVEAVENSGGSDLEASDDSDVEIQPQTYQPKSDLVNAQLTSLYAKSTTSVSSSSNGNKVGSTATGILGTDKPEFEQKSQLINPEVEQRNNMSRTVGSTTVTLIKATPGDKVEDWEANSSIPNKSSNQIQTNDGEDDDSDNDLVIIDEVRGNGVIKPLQDSAEYMREILANNSDLMKKVISISAADGNQLSSTHGKPGEHVLTDGSKVIIVRSNKGQSIPIRQSISNALPLPLPVRGTKRKLAPGSEDGKQGINNDLTPKKLKKEISVVIDTGYRLSDFAGSEKVVEEVCRLLMHLKHPEVYTTLGVTAPRGFLLHGPPGTGKTLLANAIAGELQLPMLKLTGTEFISGISGESESNIRDLFNQAVALAPCIIFIDEIDSITPKRENAQREMERRVVAQLLSCVDDLMNHGKGSQVLLIGATNRIETIDTALRRAGRFDREICLGIPDETSRHKILDVICRNLRLAPGFDLRLLAKLTPGYVGADLQALVREAAVQAVNKALIVSDEENRKNSLSMIYENVIQIPDVFPKRFENELITVTSTEEVVVESGAISSSGEEKKATDINEILLQTPISKEVQEMSAKSIENIDSTEKIDGIETLKDDKMEIDSSEPLKIPTVEKEEIFAEIVSSTAEKRNVTNVQDHNSTPISSGSQNKKEKKEEPSFLRWIREVAPLRQSQLDELYIFMDDFEIALKHVQPSSKREGFATVPDTTWNDIGALKDIREELEVSILGPVKHSLAFQMLGLNTPAGVLLCGPPGCGKTLLAKAVANEAGINFISVKGPELLNMYVGESERAVRQCFLRAKNSAPCVIFFDELDALCPRRSDSPESGSGSRIVNQLLTEMDGMESRAGVFIMAATNRPDIIDPAVLRPGRLDKILFVDLPVAEDRFEILKAITKDGRKPILADDVDLKLIAYGELCENYTGADLAALVREASIAAFRDLILSKSPESSCAIEDLKVSARHFQTALLRTKPSVTKKDRDKYSEMKERYSTLTRS